MNREHDFEKILNGGSFEEISKFENKIWILSVRYDMESDEISEETLIDLGEKVSREFLLNANSYLEYYNRKQEVKKGRKKKYCDRFAIRYKFVEKIFDHQNNLIILAEEEGIELGEGEQFKKTWNPVLLDEELSKK